ncbi:golgin IMH1-like isoform X2 [Actinidia eriantha]|uniref:golgin IMH1-like isoform X2 n=1 Tax=Actinidia eriantha TaxID=165200 RepID=UPI00258D4D99|nr:golgin IMH1-like isoform X2 [Actinidia eriantha]
MEDENKKKRNKKKKNRANKTTGDVSHGAGEWVNADQNHVIEENHNNQVLETADAQNDVLKTTVDLERCCTNGAEDASLEETIKKLQQENHMLIQKEASLEETIIKLQTQNDMHIQKEASLEETIKILQKENSTYMQKEAPLEMKLLQLQSEKDSWLQKEAPLELKLLQLQSEKDSWLQKEAGFEEKINKLIDETTSLSLKGVSLEEKIKQLEREQVVWVQTENSINETITSLNGDNARLQTQVMELEESRNYLLQENQRLTESMSGLQSQINRITSGCMSPLGAMPASGSEDMNAQMETSRLVEKLVAENEELVEKVNELCVELDLQGVTADLSPTVGSVLTVGTAETFPVADPVSEFEERKTASGERIDSPKHVKIMNEMNGGDVAIKDERENGEYIYAKDTAAVPNSPDTIDSEEIVQIPLNESEVKEDHPSLQLNRDDPKSDVDPKNDVSLADAPLIGAPFRFVSFVARYVSGADLVNKSSVNSGKVNSRN